MNTLIIGIASFLGLLSIIGYELFKRFLFPRILAWIATKKSLPFFPNGLARFVKESRIIKINSNNTFDTFFLSKNGSAFLHQILPTGTEWPTESTKYFVVPRVGTEEAANKVAENLANRGEFSIILNEDQKKMLIDHTNDPASDPVTAHMSDWQKICWKYGVYWYQDWSGQKQVEMRNISFKTKGDNDTLDNRPNENSEYLFSSYFEYGYVVDNQEDRDTIKLRVVFTISGMNDNPHIALVLNANVFSRISSILESKAGDVINESSFHRLTKKIDQFIGKLRGAGMTDAAATEETEAQNIREVFQTEIIKELSKTELGFVWDPNSVNVLQVEPVGEASIKLVEEMLKAREVEYINYVKLKENERENTIKVNNATADRDAKVIQAEGDFKKTIKDAAGAAAKKAMESAALAGALLRQAPAEKAALKARLEAAAEVLGADPNIILGTDLIKELKLPDGGINVMNIADILKLFTKEKAA